MWSLIFRVRARWNITSSYAKIIYYSTLHLTPNSKPFTLHQGGETAALEVGKMLCVIPNSCLRD